MSDPKQAAVLLPAAERDLVAASRMLVLGSLLKAWLYLSGKRRPL